MKRILWVILAVSNVGYGQYNEFKVHDNGLIYNETTMHQLGVIVDSLNLQFKTCDLSHPYYSYPQGMATLVPVSNKVVRKQIQSGITLPEFLKLHPNHRDVKKIWVYQSRYENYEGKRFIEYSGLPFGWNAEPNVVLKDQPTNDKVTGWVMGEKDDYALHLEGLTSMTLPFEYARLVQYVDCMIDTTAEIYFPIAKGQVYQVEQPNTKAATFIDWANDYPGKPEPPDYDEIEKKGLNQDSVYEILQQHYVRWDSLRMNHLDGMMATSRYYRDLLSEAAAEGVETGNSSNALEFYVGRYLSKEDALKLMRSRKAVGRCSQDQSPRYHAMNICRYAAETAQWDIFLRSHLDIMNDRFERMSDGSYAWAGRKTYLKELESLNINAVDLLIGTSLRVKNVADNHYHGSINRVGRALADAQNKDQLEASLFAMMQDPALDPFNRVLMMYLFDNYNHNLEDESRKTANQQKLQAVVQQMPDYIREIWGKGD